MRVAARGAQLIVFFFLGANLTLSPPGSKASPSQDIIFGYIKDASPVSSGNGSNFPSGFCGELAEYLDSHGFPVISRLEQTYGQRFSAFRDFKVLDLKENPVVANKQPAVECGPHSITASRKQELRDLSTANEITAEFSKPFFASSMKLLIRKDKIRDLNYNPEVIRIGAPKSTTNNQAIRVIYPNTAIEVMGSRSDGVLGLRRRSIDAYSGDEVLLIQMMKENGFSDEFSIEPKLYGFTHEEYGIVVYNSSDLLQAVNTWISSNEGQEARRRHLENRNQIANIIQVALNNNHFFLIISALAIGILFLILSHQVFILFILTLLPSKVASKLLAHLVIKSKSTSRKGFVGSFVSYIENYLLILLACKANKIHHIGFINRQEATTLIRRIGTEPLFEEYLKEGLTTDQAKKKFSQTLAEIDKSDPWLSSILRKWLNVSTEQNIETLNSELIKRLRGE
jgi:ABC-type amino acid transport substrate-binding protein